jgi:hypothetical protein
VGVEEAVWPRVEERIMDAEAEEQALGAADPSDGEADIERTL